MRVRCLGGRLGRRLRLRADLGEPVPGPSRASGTAPSCRGALTLLAASTLRSRTRSRGPDRGHDGGGVRAREGAGGRVIVLVTGTTAWAGGARNRGGGHEVHVHGSERKLAKQDYAARTYRADFASLHEVADMAAEILESEEQLDAVDNNAGIGTTCPATAGG